MAGGSRKNHDCDMQRANLEAESYPVLEGLYIIFIAFDNFSYLPFVVQFKTFKNLVRQAVKKFSSGSVEETG